MVNARLATIIDRPHTRPDPIVAASANLPSARPARPLPKENPTSGDRRAEAEERFPLLRPIEREPGGDAASEPDDDPRRKLGALRLEELFQPLSSRGKPRLPIGPSTLWKRRFPYVRGARPLHCSMNKRGKRALAQA